jgi:hypothetical protein
VQGCLYALKSFIFFLLGNRALKSKKYPYLLSYYFDKNLIIMRHDFLLSQESKILNNLFLHYLVLRQNIEDVNQLNPFESTLKSDSIGLQTVTKFIHKANELFEQFEKLPKYLNTSDESITKNFVSQIEGDFTEENIINLMRSYAEYNLSSRENYFNSLRNKIEELDNLIGQRNNENYALIEENKQLNIRIENLEAGLTDEIIDRLRRENEQLSKELWELKEGFNFLDDQP